MTKDIEREAFEITYQPDPQKSPFPYFLFNEEKNLYEAHSFDGREVSLINAAWWGWQAAKAHEAKKLEGCVVVPVEPCKWTQDEDSNWWTECGEGFVFNEDSHPHKHNFKNCCFCGGLLEAARGGNE